MKKLIAIELKQALNNSTMCDIQYGGYPCNSCFHDIIEIDYGDKLSEDVHEYWLSVLAFRGDYPKLEQKPKLIKELIKVIMEKL